MEPGGLLTFGSAASGQSASTSLPSGQPSIAAGGARNSRPPAEQDKLPVYQNFIRAKDNFIPVTSDIYAPVWDNHVSEESDDNYSPGSDSDTGFGNKIKDRESDHLIPVKASFAVSAELPKITKYAVQSDLPDKYAEQSDLPDKYAVQSDLPDKHAVHSFLPDKHVVQSVLLDKYAVQSVIPDKYAVQSDLPDKHAVHSVLPDKHAVKSVLPDKNAAQTNLPVATNISTYETTLTDTDYYYDTVDDNSLLSNLDNSLSTWKKEIGTLSSYETHDKISTPTASPSPSPAPATPPYPGRFTARQEDSTSFLVLDINPVNLTDNQLNAVTQLSSNVLNKDLYLDNQLDDQLSSPFANNDDQPWEVTAPDQQSYSVVTDQPPGTSYDPTTEISWTKASSTGSGSSEEGWPARRPSSLSQEQLSAGSQEVTARPFLDTNVQRRPLALGLKLQQPLEAHEGLPPSEQLSDSLSSTGLSFGGLSSGSMSFGGLSSGGLSSGGLYSGGLTSGGMYSGGLPSGGLSSGGLPFDGLSSGGLSSGGMSAGGLYSGGLFSGGLSAGGLYSGGLSSGGLFSGGLSSGVRFSGGTSSGGLSSGVLSSGGLTSDGQSSSVLSSGNLPTFSHSSGGLSSGGLSSGDLYFSGQSSGGQSSNILSSSTQSDPLFYSDVKDWDVAALVGPAAVQDYKKWNSGQRDTDTAGDSAVNDVEPATFTPSWTLNK